jgi:transposase
MNINDYPDKEILSQYKGQQSVENIFKFLKDPTFVGAYCLKSPERIVAFGYILLMAAQIYTILERQVRKALDNPDEKPIEGLNRIKTRKPTTYAIKHILSPILIIRKKNKKSECWTTSGELNENQIRILKFAGFNEKIYDYSIKIKNTEE